MDQQQSKITDLNLTLTPIDTKKKKSEPKTTEEECQISFQQICERSKKRGYKSVKDAENDLQSAIKELEDLRKTLSQTNENQ